MSAEDQFGLGSERENHVLLFPCPAQGHVTCMLQIAELLALSNIHVTFLNTDHVHRRLLSFADIQSRSATYPTLRFETFSNGLPDDDPRSGDVVEHIKQVKLKAKPQLMEICLDASGKPRFSCIIGDGIFGSLTNELGQELGIPVVFFRTVSACCFWAYFCAPRLFESNELPIRGEEDMDRVITGIPGMENLVRCRDLPSFFRGTYKGRIFLEPMLAETHQLLRAQALILNTFEDLEGPVLSHMRLHFPKLYTLGPLHAHLNSRKASTTTAASEEPPPNSITNSLWEVDRSCMNWLDAQPPKSVLYVSFGSITTISRDQLLEIWHGLVNSKRRFLWVVRPDMVAEQDGNDLPLELVDGTKERGCMVGWAPQQEVLEHVAVGGFMTHSGWNSTLESVAAGVPMICWPYFADQQINSRYVSEVWKIGLDMKDTCDRKIVEKMVNELMVERREEFEKWTLAMARLAKTSVGDGGSSYSDFDRLVEFLKSLGSPNRGDSFFLFASHMGGV